MPRITRPTTCLALIALMVCSACADKSTTTAARTNPYQVSALQWDATYATTSAQVNNNNLIGMR